MLLYYAPLRAAKSCLQCHGEQAAQHGLAVAAENDLLGLVPFSGCPADSDIYRLGDIAQAEKIWIYVALTYGPVEAARQPDWLQRLRVLNRYFGERLTTPNKKILILPDYFGLYKEFSHGQILADFGLTAMEGEGS